MMKNEIEKYRQEIDLIDLQIFELLKRRFDVVKMVGEYKKKNNLPIKNAMREKALIEKMSEKYSMDESFVKKFYRVIFNNSYKIED